MAPPRARASPSEPLRSVCCERPREVRDRIERRLLIRLSSDFLRKRGRSVGRHAAMTATPASTCDQISMFVTMAESFFLSNNPIHIARREIYLVGRRNRMSCLYDVSLSFHLDRERLIFPPSSAGMTIAILVMLEAVALCGGTSLKTLIFSLTAEQLLTTCPKEKFPSSQPYSRLTSAASRL